MFNTILLLFSAFVGVIGTIYAVLSILALTPDEVHKSITLKGIDERDKELIIQKKQARLGIMLVISAWILQCVFSFVKINCLCWFLFALVATICLVLIEIVIMSILNRKFEEKCVDYGTKRREEEKKKWEDQH